MREVQAFNRAEENIENFRIANAANRDANIRAVAFTSALAPTLEALGYLALAIVTGVGGLALLRGEPLFGTTVTSPVFGVEVPVLAHPAAEMDKGAGIAMCCTFGDLTDVQWWRELQLPVRTVIGRDGRLTRETPEWLSSEQAAGAYERLAGKTTFSAREEMVAMLREIPDVEIVGFYDPHDDTANEVSDKYHSKIMILISRIPLPVIPL